MDGKSAQRPVFSRILVALDATRESLAALDAAAYLASRPDAELVGIFVEDVNLLRAAEHPFTHEINISTGGRERFDPESVARAFRAQAKAAELALAAAARARRVRYKFAVRRGDVAHEIVAAAMNTDVVVIGKRTRALARLGSTARAVASRAAATCIVTEGYGLAHIGSVSVAYDGSVCADKALAFASRLATFDDGELTVMILAPDRATADARGDRARELLEESGIAARFRRVGAADSEHLALAVHDTRCGILVLGGECPSLANMPLDGLLRAVHCPVLIVRTSA